MLPSSSETFWNPNMVEPQTPGSSPKVDATEISAGAHNDVQRNPSPVPSPDSDSQSWHALPYVSPQVEDDPDETKSLRDPPRFFLGALYNGISNLDPTSQAFHHALAKMQEMKRQAEMGDNQEKSSLPRDIVTNAESPKSESPTYVWPPAPLTRFPSGSLYEIPTSQILCPAYVSGSCHDGDRCTLSHDADAACFGICQTFLLGTCTANACTHKPYPLHHFQNRKIEENKLADDLESKQVAENRPMTT